MALTGAQRSRAYRERHPERAQAAVHSYSERNRNKIKSKAIAYRRADTMRAIVNDMFNDARRRARAKGLPFTITRADITVPALCPYLGIPLERGAKGGGKTSPSLDRVIPVLGYVPGNIEVISKLANWIKNCGTAKEILRVGTRMRQMEGR